MSGNFIAKAIHTIQNLRPCFAIKIPPIIPPIVDLGTFKVIILESVGVPSEGIAIILGVDRILDMCRTVINVTGDASVCSIVNSWVEKK